MTEPKSSFNQVLSSEPPYAVLAEAVRPIAAGKEFEMQQMDGQGMDNRIYRIDVGNTAYVLRINDLPHAESCFHKENWCLKQAKSAGIPTAELVEHGAVEGWQYVVHGMIDGTPGEKYQGDLRAVWRTLGGLARQINQISTLGYGSELCETETNKFSKNWQTWISEELAKIDDDSGLIDEKVIDAKQKALALQMLQQLENWKFTPCLCHGDLSLSNAIIGRNNSVTIIDWGNAASHRAAHFDFAEVSVWNPTGDAFADFAAGYGLSDPEQQQVFEEMKLIELWRALWAARRDIANYKERWRDAMYIERSISKIDKILQAAD